MNIGINLDCTGKGPSRGLSWNQWVKLLYQRAQRALLPQLPPTVRDPIWQSMADWIEGNLFTGANTPRSQFEYYKQHDRGMYGGGMPTSGQADHIINAWEKLGDGDRVKAEIQAQAGHAQVLVRAGPPFLRSMRALGPITEVAQGMVGIGVHTLATMTPYRPGAGPTRPIMHYLREGWQDPISNRFMRPRWPDGVAPFIRQAKPYVPYMSMISRYLIQGR